MYLAHEESQVKNGIILLEMRSVARNIQQIVPFQIPLPTIDEYV
jgi:hypothetical protein